MKAFASLVVGASAGCDYGYDKSHGWDKSKDHSGDAEEIKNLAKALNFGTWLNNQGWYEVVNDLNVTSSCSGMCCTDHVCCDTIDGKNRVVSLKLERNNLKGTFPDSFYKLSELREVDAHLNKIKAFPKRLPDMPKLEQVKFGRNPITGAIPSEWMNFGKQLSKLNCNFCALEGQFPDVFDNLPNLEEAYWNGNGFTGTLPSSLAKLTGLTKISFNLNSLTGDIPEGLCELPLLHDCRIGGDTDFEPYDTSDGSPEKKWLKSWKGNKFNNCPSVCVSDNICNNGGPAYMPGHYGPPSPLKCGNAPTPSPSPTPTPTPSPPPSPSPSLDCDEEVQKCMTRCTDKYSGGSLERGADAYFCSKGCALISSGKIQDADYICGEEEGERQLKCEDNCDAASASNPDRVKMCKYGCGYWASFALLTV